jgi:signal transduction histidine kinase
MQIRTKLTLQFLLIGGMIMIIASVAIYYASAGFRKDSFYNRLNNKARSSGMLILDATKIDAALVRKIERNNPDKLFDEKIIILNFADNVVYSTDDSSEIVITPAILKQIRNGNKVYYRQDRYEVLGTLYYTKYNRIVVLAAAIDVEGFEHLEKLRLILILVCSISIFVFLIAGWFYSDRALKPISDVVNKVEEITITSLNLRLNEGNGTDEIGRLAKTFNRMLERLEKSFAMQKDFIANASHELRTPLTSISGQLDVLLMKDRSIDEYKAAVSSVLDDTRALIDLSNRLLLIARTSAEGPLNYRKNIRVDEIIWQAREELLRYNPLYKINIVMGESFTDMDQMIVGGDEYLLKVAMANIIDNGCKYSNDHRVNITLEHKVAHIEIVVEDQGIGIPEKDIHKVFQPFYRGTNAHPVRGSGIGLQLVNQIVTNYHGKVFLLSVEGKGTKVTVELPNKNMLENFSS